MTNGKTGRRSPAITKIHMIEPTLRAQRIREVRKEKMRMDQATIGKLIGVTHATISHWERGGEPSEDNLRRYAEVTGTDYEYLQGSLYLDPFAIRSELDSSAWGEIIDMLKPQPAEEVHDILSSIRDFLVILLKSRDEKIKADRKRAKGRDPAGNDDYDI
jgi:transcriptional regulator with XRE-family HTH domain